MHLLSFGGLRCEDVMHTLLRVVTVTDWLWCMEKLKGEVSWHR